jgi:uncharacterized protein
VIACWQRTADGVLIDVKVQPKSRRPGLQGVALFAGGYRLRIGVAEPAESGKANRAAQALLAQSLRVPQSSVQLLQGATSREKRFEVSGDTDILVTRLANL